MKTILKLILTGLTLTATLASAPAFAGNTAKDLEIIVVSEG